MKTTLAKSAIRKHDLRRNWKCTVALAAVASLVCVSRAVAYCGQEHPFNWMMIQYFSVLSSPFVADGVLVGGAAGIDQGAHGDCWLEASLAALARSHEGARLISDMIVQSGNAYDVTFLDDPTHSYPVTQADMQRVHVKDSAVWADAIEAATINRFPLLEKGKTGAHELGHKMGEPTSVFGLSMLTGHQASLLILQDSSNEEIGQTLERNIRMRIPMTASTPKTLPVQAVVTNHVYTIMSYEPYSRMVMLRNPWGTNVSKEFPDLPQTGQTKFGVQDLGGGVVQMHLSSFTKYYKAMTWSRVFHV